MAVRPMFLGALGVVTVGVAAAAGVTSVVHAHDRADARAATSAAHRLSLPAGMQTSHVCHGDGIVACLTTTEPSQTVVEAMRSAVATAVGKPATVTCWTVKFGAAKGQQSCMVASRWGGHALLASVDPRVVAKGGKPVLDGVLVSVSTG